MTSMTIDSTIPALYELRKGFFDVTGANAGPKHFSYFTDTGVVHQGGALVPGVNFFKPTSTQARDNRSGITGQDQKNTGVSSTPSSGPNARL